MDTTSRREFLKLAGAGAAVAAIGARPAAAQGKSLTVLHESSFIPPFDEYFKTTLAEAYEKETGVRVVYEVTAVGSAPTRISTIAETGTGADIAANGLLQVIQFGDKYLDVTDLCGEIGQKNGGWYDAGREAVVVDGQWKAVPFCNIGQLMNWRTDWFAEVGVEKFPETWEELYEIGKKLKAKDTRSASSWGTALATTTAGSIRYCGPMAGTRSKPMVRPSSSIQTRRPAPLISPANSSATRCSRMCWAGPTSATTRRGWPSRSPAPTMPRVSSGSPRGIFLTSPRSPTRR